MNVTFIGAGNMGRSIGHRLVSGGGDMTVVDRDPEEAGRLAEELCGAARGIATVEAAGPGAKLSGEVVILAVYFPGEPRDRQGSGGQTRRQGRGGHIQPLKRDLRWARHRAGHLGGRGGGTERTGRREGGQGLQHHLLRHASRRPGGRPAARCAHRRGRRGQGEGGSTRARRRLRAIDMGPLERARELEGLGFLGMMLQQALELNFRSA